MDRNVILLLGSNILPEINIPRAIQLLKQTLTILSSSSIWKTHPEGGVGNDYHNIALEIQTAQPYDHLKNQQLRDIENQLGRIRGVDKYAPRTMDIDIILDNEIIMDTKIWQYAFIAVPVSQLRPNLMMPSSAQTLSEFAENLKKTSWIVELPAYPFS
jgi:2-amino-4-hydroxy-6-hydroxymethyldihydropteridine diphosphokinase